MCLASMQSFSKLRQNLRNLKNFKNAYSQTFLYLSLVIIQIVNIRFKEPPQCAK